MSKKSLLDYLKLNPEDLIFKSQDADLSDLSKGIKNYLKEVKMVPLWGMSAKLEKFKDLTQEKEYSMVNSFSLLEEESKEVAQAAKTMERSSNKDVYVLKLLLNIDSSG